MQIDFPKHADKSCSAGDWIVEEKQSFFHYPVSCICSCCQYAAPPYFLVFGVLINPNENGLWGLRMIYESA